VPFYLNDIPAEPFVIEPPLDVPLTDFTAATATLRKPDGITETGLTATIDEDAVHVAFPADASVLDVEGVHRLRVTLTGTGTTRRLPGLPIVVQDEDSEWHTLDTLREEWVDAEHIGDATLWELLSVARGDVLEFAPALADGDPIPDRFRVAQRMHTRNLWNAARVAPDGATGEGDFVFRPHPLDWHVKALLRPRRGIPTVH
jgi:hypothetical protein